MAGRGRTRAAAAGTVAAVVALVACEPAGEPDREPVVRDSAGVTIVEHPFDPAEPPSESPVPWTLADEPALELGRMEGEGPDLFGEIRDVAHLPSGDVAVADVQVPEIRVFDEAGEHVRTVGRPGQGPGEFRSIWWMDGLPGDSLVVVDHLQRRASVFAPDGEPVRSFRLDPAVGQEAGAVGAGDLVGGDRLVVEEDVVGPAEGEDRMEIRVHTVDLEGEEADEVGLFPHVDLGGPQNRGVPLSGWLVVAAGDSLVWAGHTADFQLRGFDAEGTLRRIIRLDRRPEPVTSRDVEAILEHVGEDEGEGFARLLQQTGFADHYPVHGRLLVDELGYLWVERFRLSARLGGAAPQEAREAWDIFEPDGRLVATLTLPEGFETARAGEDFVMGVHTDRLGVQRIQVYPLERD